MPLKLTLLNTGFCTHPEAVVMQGGRWQSASFPSLFALIEHPIFGIILFDTGYSQRFFQETQQFPERLYAIVTPVSLNPNNTAISQLQQRNIPATSVNTIILSHFHADHIGGVQDFPDARFLCLQSAYTAVKQQQGLGAVVAGFLKGLLPNDFEQRCDWVETKPTVALPAAYAPFETGFDLLGDGSLLAVDLPGHVTGQLGLFVVTEDTHYFLIADACWMSRAYQELLMPHPIARLILSNWQDYRTTLQKIHQLHQSNPTLQIIPTHCHDTWRAIDTETIRSHSFHNG